MLPSAEVLLIAEAPLMARGLACCAARTSRSMGASLMELDLANVFGPSLEGPLAAELVLIGGLGFFWSCTSDPELLQSKQELLVF
mmetsp:Transcript_37582/g.82469  ORF Transcript_37582/g.82469 Transcript_37582/m.82469 type:complete len:85 (+) Transcript_37582:1353-1607(+)